MKKILICSLTIICSISMDTYAQNAQDYFYPFEKEAVIYESVTLNNQWGSKRSCLFTTMDSDYYLVNQHVDLAGVYKRGATLNESAERLMVYKNRIESIQRINDNFLLGRTVKDSKQTLLVLPQVGKPVKLMQTEDNGLKYECTYTLVALTVDIYGERQDINAIKVTKKIQNTPPATEQDLKNGNYIEYWGKNLGKIFMIIGQNHVFAQSAELSSSYYKEKAYYDVEMERKRREQEAEMVRQKKEQEAIRVLKHRIENNDCFKITELVVQPAVNLNISDGIDTLGIYRKEVINLNLTCVISKNHNFEILHEVDYDNYPEYAKRLIRLVETHIKNSPIEVGYVNLEGKNTPVNSMIDIRFEENRVETNRNFEIIVKKKKKWDWEIYKEKNNKIVHKQGLANEDVFYIRLNDELINNPQLRGLKKGKYKLNVTIMQSFLNIYTNEALNSKIEMPYLLSIEYKKRPSTFVSVLGGTLVVIALGALTAF